MIESKVVEGKVSIEKEDEANDESLSTIVSNLKTVEVDRYNELISKMHGYRTKLAVGRGVIRQMNHLYNKLIGLGAPEKESVQDYINEINSKYEQLIKEINKIFMDLTKKHQDSFILVDGKRITDSERESILEKTIAHEEEVMLTLDEYKDQIFELNTIDEYRDMIEDLKTEIKKYKN